MADEVRLLAANTGQFNNEIRNTLNDITQSMEKMGASIVLASETDFSIAEHSQENLSALGKELVNLSEMAKEHSHQITEVTEKIHTLTMEGVVAVQFEDIVTQMMDRISQRTQSINNLLTGFMILHNDPDEANEIQRIRKRIQGLQNLLENTGSVMAKQEKSAAGIDIELF